jgi:hypothetical protein
MGTSTRNKLEICGYDESQKRIDPHVISLHVFNESKYSNCYWRIIDRAKNRVLDKFEKHHILPKGKHLFPEYKDLKEHPWNCVCLSLREHYICHRLLVKMTKGVQRLSCAYALRRLSSVQTKFSSRQYEKAKLIYREQRKLNPSPLRGKTGRTWSKEERLAHSDRLKKRMSDPITKQKCSLAKTGKPGTRHSEETKRKISEAQRNLSEEQRARKSRSKSGSKNPAFGKKWYNNGEKAKQFIPGEEPDGWFIGKRLVQISK